MSKEELIEFLKANLAVELDTWGTMCSSGYEIRLILNGEVISSDKITTESSE